MLTSRAAIPAGGRMKSAAAAAARGITSNLAVSGLWANVVQLIFQGILSGAVSIFLFTRAVVLLGAARAAVFPTLVPPFTLLIGYLVLDVVPTVFQLIGLVMVLIGFRLTQKN